MGEFGIPTKKKTCVRGTTRKKCVRTHVVPRPRIPVIAEINSPIPKNKRIWPPSSIYRFAVIDLSPSFLPIRRHRFIDLLSGNEIVPDMESKKFRWKKTPDMESKNFRKLRSVRKGEIPFRR